jgi:hypothetical protein
MYFVKTKLILAVSFKIKEAINITDIVTTSYIKVFCTRSWFVLAAGIWGSGSTGTLYSQISNTEKKFKTKKSGSRYRKLQESEYFLTTNRKG